MIYIIPPEVTPGTDAFLAEDTLEIPQRPDAVLFPGTLSDADYDLLLIVFVDIRVIGRHVGQKALGGIVI